MRPLSFPISVPQQSWRVVGGQFESHGVRTQRIRMLVLARALRGLSKHPACFAGRELDTKKAHVICPRPQTKMGKVCWWCPASFFFKVFFSLKQSSSSAVGWSFSVHSCLLSVKEETGWGMGQGNYALKKGFFPPSACKHSNNDWGWSLSRSKGSWLYPVGNCVDDKWVQGTVACPQGAWRQLKQLQAHWKTKHDCRSVCWCLK